MSYVSLVLGAVRAGVSLTEGTIPVANANGDLVSQSDFNATTNALVVGNTKHLEIQAYNETALTGSLALLTATAGNIVLTNGSLISIRGIIPNNDGAQLILVNRTGNSVVLVDSSMAVGTAANRIICGTGANLTFLNDTAIFLQYDIISSRWQIIGGSGASSSGTPATTVQAETSYGISSAVGTSTDYARADHTHGTMATPTKTTVGLSNVLNLDQSNPSNITQDSTHRFATDSEKTSWNAKIDSTEKGAASGVATLDSNSLIPIAQIPPAALERLVIVADQTARFALTISTVQNGDTIKQTDTGEMYYIKDDTNLGNSTGYSIYTAGTATSAASITGSLSGDVTSTGMVTSITGLSAAKISSGVVSNTEFDYLDGVTSSIQTQLNGKQASLPNIYEKTLVVNPDVTAGTAISLPTSGTFQIVGGVTNLTMYLNGLKLAMTSDWLASGASSPYSAITLTDNVYVGDLLTFVVNRNV